jgi:CBS-domain-containing membrane protein
MNISSSALLQKASFPVLVPGGPETRPFAVDPHAPATVAMTDFRTAPLVTANYDASIDDALGQMKLSGARFAFVLGKERQLVGSVTSYDIQGEKPVQYMVSVGCSETTCAWRDVQVENIMEPVSQWYVLDVGKVAAMTIAQMAALMTDASLRYLVVVEAAAGPAARQVRGLFSAARLQLLLAGSEMDAGAAKVPSYA